MRNMSSRTRLKITGKFHCEREDDQVTYGFIDPKINGHPLSPDPDKFIVSGPDYDTASAEFWGRWKSYIQRRFNLNYLRIESL